MPEVDGGCRTNSVLTNGLCRIYVLFLKRLAVFASNIGQYQQLDHATFSLAWNIPVYAAAMSTTGIMAPLETLW